MQRLRVIFRSILPLLSHDDKDIRRNSQQTI
jgi:hypothetical protein